LPTHPAAVRFAAMPKPFDAASKHLIESRPQDWLRLAGFPVPKSTDYISIVDAD
jgi:hypothetical protein